MASRGDGSATIRVHFSVEFLPPWLQGDASDEGAESDEFFVEVQLGQSALVDAIASWDQELAAFPIVEHGGAGAGPGTMCPVEGSLCVLRTTVRHCVLRTTVVHCVLRTTVVHCVLRTTVVHCVLRPTVGYCRRPAPGSDTPFDSDQEILSRVHSLWYAWLASACAALHRSIAD